uniref:Uncharacterized protein n=1 Tax=Ditylenchus dipsaci TaxID=166011 RepID=A0A915EJX8_9BILA
MNNRGARPELELDQEAGSCYAEDRDLDASFNQIVSKLLQCATTISGACDYSREFNTLFRQLKAFIATDLSERRRQDFSLILTEAYTLYCQLYYLHHCPQDPKFYASYAEKVGKCLPKTVDHSFTPEYRKIQITLGLVDVLCELFVQEVQVFGHQVDFHPPVAPSFVTGTIAEVPSLAQYYAGLVRNLSWNADEEMAGALRLAVPALVAAAVQVYEGGEGKCLLAVLSALWNLASHSVDNKRQFVLNALGALCFLAEHNQAVHYQLLSNQPAMLSQEPVEQLAQWSCLFAAFSTPGRNTRSHYGGVPSCSGPSSHNYIYNRRQVSNPPSQSFSLNAPSVQTLPRSLHLYKDEHCYPQEECGNPAVRMEDPHRSLSLPRHVAGENANDISSTWQEKNAINGNDLTESMQATRSGSVESLNLNLTDVRFQNSTEYPSTLASAVNSGMESPASESELLLELPDSPLSVPLTCQGQGTLKRETTGDQQHKVDDDDTNRKEGIYAFEEGVDQETTGNADDLISNMIQMVLPKPSSRLQNPSNPLSSQRTPTKKGANHLIALQLPLFHPENITTHQFLHGSSHCCHLNVTPNCSFGGMDIDWDENSRLEESPGKPAAPSSSNSSQVTTKNWRAEVDGITKQPPKGLKSPRPTLLL